MTTHVVDLWLARVIRAALDRPGLDWPAVVDRNPAAEVPCPGTATPTPAALAHRTMAFGDQLDWDRYRHRCIDAGGTPFGELDADTARWMDAGMFARWLLGESMPWASPDGSARRAADLRRERPAPGHARPVPAPAVASTMSRGPRHPPASDHGGIRWWR